MFLFVYVSTCIYVSIYIHTKISNCTVNSMCIPKGSHASYFPCQLQVKLDCDSLYPISHSLKGE